MAAQDANEDLPFQHFTLKHRIIAWISVNLFDGFTYTVSRGLLKGMKRKGGLGWIPSLSSSSAATPEERFWHDLNLSGMTVYDVGSFHGLLALLFASRAKSVVCFEPNKRNRTRLLENLALNNVKNVKVRDVGVGSQRATLTMVGDPLMPGGSSVDSKLAEQICKSSSATVVEQINVVTLDEEIQESNLPAPDFIKIDIEGWELEAMRGARKTLETYKPAMFLEMPGETIREKKRKVAEIVAFLWEIHYRNIIHVETGVSITPENSAVAMEGHLYCRP